MKIKKSRLMPITADEVEQATVDAIAELRAENKRLKNQNDYLKVENQTLVQALENILKVKRTVDLNLFDIEKIHEIAEEALEKARAK